MLRQEGAGMNTCLRFSQLLQKYLQKNKGNN